MYDEVMQSSAPISCPFCRENGLLKGDVLAETTGGYLIANSFDPGSFLIIPAKHAEEVGELPDDWWHDFKTLFTQVPNVPSDFNITLNHGELAGQNVKHLHFWVIPRAAGQPSSGKGLARLIDDANKE